MHNWKNTFFLKYQSNCIRYKSKNLNHINIKSFTGSAINKLILPIFAKLVFNTKNIQLPKPTLKNPDYGKFW